MNKFPKRAESHIKESDSLKILQNHIPSRWIIREVSERDYGIDCYIELTNKNGEVAGNLLSGQLKGTNRLKWKDKENGTKECTFPGIKIETINYWMELPVPVFLLVADLTDRNLYFAPIKQQVRSQYSKYQKQKSMSFSFSNHYNIGTDRGLLLFELHYIKEHLHSDFVSALHTVFIHWETYLEFIQGKQCLDCFLGVEPDEELLFIHIYQTLRILSKPLSIDWSIESLVDIIQKDNERWKDSPYMLHYQTFNEMLPEIEHVFFQIIQKARDKITRVEKDYWKTTNLILYLKAKDLEYLKPGYKTY